jgi:LCP family protein required for cell wall assembly
MPPTRPPQGRAPMPPPRPPQGRAPMPPELDPRRRTSGTSGAARPAAPPRTSRRGRLIGRVARGFLFTVAAATALAVLAVAATGYTVLQWSTKKIARVDAFAGLTDRPAPSADGSSTFLLVGSDAREGMSAADMSRLHLGSVATAAGRRADTMLMLHVSPQQGTVTVVSLPRDSYVTIPAHLSATDGTQVRQSRNKLNSAYAWGGAPLTVATVERTTGVRIDHYLEIDFLGFVRLVDAVGGVDVCAPTRLRDHKAGLRLPKGVSHVDGETGLAYVRARHIDARADLGRVDRQQRFLGAMFDRVTSRDVLLDPRALVRFLNAALDAVHADPGLTEKELVTLGTDLRHSSGKDVRFRTVPIANPSYRARGAGSVALWDDAAASTLFTAMREDTKPRRPAKGGSSLAVPPDQISVRVYNGSTTVGLGTQATQELSGRGFAIAGAAQNWRTRDVGRTILRYDARYSDSIRTLAAAVPGARLVAVPGLGHILQVVIGSQYEGTRTVQVAASASATGVGAADSPSGRAADADPCS